MQITITVKGEPKKDCLVCKGKGSFTRYSLQYHAHLHEYCECCAEKSHMLTYDEAVKLIGHAIISAYLDKGEEGLRGDAQTNALNIILPEGIK